VIGVVLLSALPARAEEMIVTLPEVLVYSGPSLKFYPTTRLYAGQKVEVVKADDQPGWLAIKPPEGSFSWISQGFVQLSPNGRMATVLDDGVSVLPGSSVSRDAPSVEKIKLKRGQIVTVLDVRPEHTPTGTWLPIAPAAGEVRYIEAHTVKTVKAAPATPPPQQPGNPNNAAAPPAQFAGGWKAGDQPRTDQPRTDQPRTDQPRTDGPRTDGPRTDGPRTPGQTMSLYNKDAPPTPASITPAPPANQPPPANQSQYSPYGVLRKTAFQINGQPMYVLEDAQSGQPLVYVAAPPGFTLNPYIGRGIRVYGTTSYRTGDYPRTYYVTATHVALY
jgi:hypothetical protein